MAFPKIKQLNCFIKKEDCCWLTKWCWNWTGLTSLKSSIFIVNDFYYTINSLNINGVTTYRGRGLDTMTLNVFTTSSFYLYSEENSLKLLIPKMKLKRIDTCSICKFYDKLFRGFRENDRFSKNLFSTSFEKFKLWSQFFTE